jgi:N-acetyl-gamma-glutamyl-phosphate reductase
VEVVFAALPHGAFAARAQAFLDMGLRVVDLSADFRLRSAEEFRLRYGLAHPAPHLLGESVYGLTEWCGRELEAARLVANPGCYATALLLAALPAVAAGWWSGGTIVANALSGVSGAGRAPSLTTHFAECANSVAPYKVGESHAHLGEIGQAIRELGSRGAASRAGATGATLAGRATGAAGATLAVGATGTAGAGPAVGGATASPASAGGYDSPVVFSPHLVPMARGIVANVAIPLVLPREQSEAEALYRERYAGAAFVRMLADEALPEARYVRGSNRCDLAVRVAAGGTMLLVFAALDNLVKGAAGQAIQNWNRMQGWPEATGLPLAAWACA